MEDVGKLLGPVHQVRPRLHAEHVPTELRGSAFGLLAGIQSLGNLAASTIAGLIWTALNPSWALAYLAACMAIALATLTTSTKT